MADFQPMTPSAPVPLTPQRPWRRIALIAGIVTLLIVVGGVGYIWYRTTHSTTETAVINPQASLEKGDLKTAMADADKVLATDPDNVLALVQKSIATSQAALSSSQRNDIATEGARLAQQAIDASSGKSTEAYRALGFANEVMGNYAAAHAAYEKSLEIDPKNPLSLVGNGEAYEFDGDLVKAKTNYDAALAADAETYPAHMGLGRLHQLAGENEAALAEFKKVYGYSPNQNLKAQAATAIGVILVAEKNYDLARAYLEKATAFDKTYAQGWFVLGTAYYGQSVTAAADPSLRQQALDVMKASMSALTIAVSLDPSLALAHLQMAVNFNAVKDTANARTEAGRAKAAVPNDASLSDDAKEDTLARIEAFEVTLK